MKFSLFDFRSASAAICAWCYCTNYNRPWSSTTSHLYSSNRRLVRLVLLILKLIQRHKWSKVKQLLSSSQDLVHNQSFASVPFASNRCFGGKSAKNDTFLGSHKSRPRVWSRHLADLRWHVFVRSLPRLLPDSLLHQ